MRLALLLASLLAATPLSAHSSDGALALAGIEGTARDLCGYTTPTADPSGLTTALDSPLGDAMGLRNSDSIIGIIAANDPQAGAQMWASTTANGNGGCGLLTRILSRPSAETIAELN